MFSNIYYLVSFKGYCLFRNILPRELVSWDLRQHSLHQALIGFTVEKWLMRFVVLGLPPRFSKIIKISFGFGWNKDDFITVMETKPCDDPNGQFLKLVAEVLKTDAKTTFFSVWGVRYNGFGGKLLTSCSQNSDSM